MYCARMRPRRGRRGPHFRGTRHFGKTAGANGGAGFQAIPVNRGGSMFRNNRLQMLAVLAVGAAGGWLAASGRLPLLPRSEAAPPAQAVTTPAPDAPCCDGADRGLLLAKANPATAALPL